MSFPSKIYGDFGDEKVTSTSKIGGLPLGIRMVLPDGREFAHARASATALVAGSAYQQAAIPADTAMAKALVVNAAAAGATTLSITAGGTTAFTKDQFADGYIAVASSVGTGIGHLYKVKVNNSAATGAAATFTLHPNDAIKVALNASTLVGVRVNEFNQVLLTTANTVATGIPAGVAPVAVAASSYCWLQRKGAAAWASAGTVLIAGLPVLASTAVAGQCTVAFATTAGYLAARNIDIWGHCETIAADTGYAIVYLELP